MIIFGALLGSLCAVFVWYIMLYGESLIDILVSKGWNNDFAQIILGISASSIMLFTFGVLYFNFHASSCTMYLLSLLLHYMFYRGIDNAYTKNVGTNKWIFNLW